MKRFLVLIILLIFPVAAQSAVLFDYDFKGGTPATGDKTEETTTQTTKNGLVCQQALQAGGQGQRVNGTNGNIDISRGTIECRFQLAIHSEAPNHNIYGVLTSLGGAGDFYVYDNGTGTSQGIIVTTFDSGGVKRESQFYGGEVGAIRGDDTWHLLTVHFDSSAPVSGVNHMAIYLDTVEIPPTQAITTGWTVAAERSNYAAMGDAGGSAFVNPMDGYIEHMVITDTIETPGSLVPSLPTFTVNEIPSNRKVVPYNSLNQGTQSFTGGYDTLPPGVEVRIFKRDGGPLETVQVNGQDWNSLTNQVIGSGNWSGDLGGIPADFNSNWYGFEARDSGTPANAATSTGEWGVGYFAGVIGQSNPQRMFETDTEGVTWNPLTCMSAYPDLSGACVAPVTGDGGKTLANTIQAQKGCPVKLFDFGRDFTALTEAIGGVLGWWLTDPNPGDPWTDFFAAVTASGGVLHDVFWYQGETDAYGASTEYQPKEALFITQIRGSIPHALGGTLPVFVSLIGRDTTGASATDAEWSAINSAKRTNATSIPEYYKITTVDQPLSDNVHLNGAGYVVLGERYAQKALAVAGDIPLVAHPDSTLMEVQTDTVTRVTIELTGDTDFTPSTGIDSYQVNIGTIGAPNWVSAVGARVDSTHIDLTHASGPGVQVRALYGQNPAIANIPVGNVSGLPLIQNYNILPLSTEIYPGLLLLSGCGIVGSNDYGMDMAL